MAIMKIARGCFVVAFATFGAFCSSSVMASGQPISLPASTDWGEDLRGPLCGVYAACNAARLLGIDADPRDFVAAKYVGKCGGSTEEEISNVLEQCGLKAWTTSRLSLLEIRALNLPLIANVRLSPATDRFNHWVVAVAQGDRVLIYDGVDKPYAILPAEFLGQWNGHGICVSSGASRPKTSALMLRAASFTVFGGVLLILRELALKSRNLARWRMPRAATGILCASVAIAVLGNLFFGDLGNHAAGVRVASANSAAESISTCSLTELIRASKSSDILLVDARLERDYQRGTIPGAVNIPVSARAQAISAYLADVSHDTKVFVFCQSELCAYDELIASEIAALGFSEVTACNVGWREYQSQSLPQELRGNIITPLTEGETANDGAI